MEACNGCSVAEILSAAGTTNYTVGGSASVRLQSPVTNFAAVEHSHDLSEPGPLLQLQEVELWKRFKSVTNEMIVTKSGRRMFPVIRCSLRALEERTMYSIVLEFTQVGDSRWKFQNGEWITGGKAEPPSRHTLFLHPESPNFGSHWIKSTVAFNKVKLTNKPTNDLRFVVLNSLHLYEPRVHVIRVGDRRIDTFSLEDAQFIAVTAYQNEEVTALKVRYNPFAKAFLDSRDRGHEEVSFSQHSGSSHLSYALMTTPPVKRRIQQDSSKELATIRESALAQVDKEYDNHSTSTKTDCNNMEEYRPIPSTRHSDDCWHPQGYFDSRCRPWVPHDPFDTPYEDPTLGILRNSNSDSVVRPIISHGFPYIQFGPSLESDSQADNQDTNIT